MVFYTVEIRFRNLPPFNWTDLGQAPALGRLSARSPNRSSTTARPAHRILSREWLGLLNPNPMHKHDEVSIKNWARRCTNAGHRLRQNHRMTAQIRWNALLAWQISGARAEDRLANGTWPRDRNLN